MDANSATVAALWVSFAATLIALFATFVSYIVYRSQSDPDVVVHVATDEQRPTMILILIENLGNASAQDVSFSTSGVVPSRAFGLAADTAADAPPMQSGPLISGIPFFPPGGKRVITWGQYGGLSKALAGETILVTATFSSHHIGLPWKLTHTATFPLEIASFAETDASDQRYLKQIAEHTKALVKAVEGLKK